MRAKSSSLRKRKESGEERGGRMLLGDDTGGGAVVLRPGRFQYVGFWISQGLICIDVGYITDQSHNPGL